MAERYKFPFGNTVGVQENLISINEEAIKGLRQRIDRFKFLVREQGLSPNDAKKIVIEEFKLNRNPKAGTPKWMSKGKTELIAEGFDYQASARGPKNVGGVEKAAQKRKQVIGEGRKFEERIKRTKQKTGLGKVYEIAHTANIFQAKKLGIDYPIDALAIQTQDVNNKVAEVLNDELKPLYRKQLKLFNKMKRKNTPALAKQMDKINFQIGELVATGGSQGDAAANVLKPIIVDPDTVKGKILDLGFDTSTEVMTSPGATTKATAAGSVDDVMARANVESVLRNNLVKAAETNEGGVCNIFRAEGGRIGFAVGSNCARQMEFAFDSDPIKTTEQVNKIKTIPESIKNAGSGFLNFVKRGGKFGALAAVGAGAAAIVKPYMNDDMSTYLSDEGQQKNMLKSMILDPITQPDEKITEDEVNVFDKAYLPTLGAVTAAGAVPGGKRLFDVRKRMGAGNIRSALSPIRGVLGKGLAATGTPLGIAALEPLYIASQIAEGDSLGEIATNPLNYLAPAFMGGLSKEATRFASPMASKIMRLGASPAALKTVSRRFGLPGLALSSGVSAYEMFRNKREGRGLFDDG